MNDDKLQMINTYKVHGLPKKKVLQAPLVATASSHLTLGRGHYLSKLCVGGGITYNPPPPLRGPKQLASSLGLAPLCIPPILRCRHGTPAAELTVGCEGCCCWPVLLREPTQQGNGTENGLAVDLLGLVLPIPNPFFERRQAQPDAADATKRKQSHSFLICRLRCRQGDTSTTPVICRCGLNQQHGAPRHPEDCTRKPLEPIDVTGDC